MLFTIVPTKIMLTEDDKRISKNYQFIHGNLQSYDLLKYIFESNPVTHIIHFAAQSHVQTSFTDSHGNIL